MSEPTLYAVLAALFDCAPKCYQCDRVATRGDSGARRCDRDECNTVEVCGDCGCRDYCGTVEHPRCAECGSTSVRREVDHTTLEDLPHADSLRAANAAHEARR